MYHHDGSCLGPVGDTAGSIEADKVSRPAPSRNPLYELPARLSGKHLPLRMLRTCVYVSAWHRVNIHRPAVSTGLRAGAARFASDTALQGKIHQVIGAVVDGECWKSLVPETY